MNNMFRLLENYKNVTKNVINDMKLTDIVFGEVIKANPLKIKLDSKLTLGVNQLILTRNVTNYKVEIEHLSKIKTINYDYPEEINPGKPYYSEFGNSEIKIKNELTKGEFVVMIRLMGGQKFLVLDRLVR